VPNECAFCPSTVKLTGEHVWSNWINKLLLPDGKITFRRVDFNGSEINRWPAQELNMKMKVVCKLCNEGWMSRAENNFAKPAMTDLILGNRIGAFSKKRAYGLSIFAFKTAVIANHSLPKSEWFFPPSDRYAFRESFAVPPNVTMFIFGMERSTSGEIRSFNVSYPDQRNGDITLNVCSFCIGQLGFQVISARAFNSGKIQSLPTPPDITSRFYPTLDEKFSWPRRRVLSKQAFNDFALRWTKIKRL
jgi:hypothetical protein